MQQGPFQQMWHHDVQRHANFYFCYFVYEHHIYLTDCFVVILKFYTLPMFFACHQKLCKPESIFKQTCVNLFYHENMTSFLNYVTATLRALFVWHGFNCFPQCFMTITFVLEEIYVYISVVPNMLHKNVLYNYFYYAFCK